MGLLLSTLPVQHFPPTVRNLLPLAVCGGRGGGEKTGITWVLCSTGKFSIQDVQTWQCF